MHFVMKQFISHRRSKIFREMRHILSLKFATKKLRKTCKVNMYYLLLFININTYKFICCAHCERLIKMMTSEVKSWKKQNMLCIVNLHPPCPFRNITCRAARGFSKFEFHAAEYVKQSHLRAQSRKSNGW